MENESINEEDKVLRQWGSNNDLNLNLQELNDYVDIDSYLLVAKFGADGEILKRYGIDNSDTSDEKDEEDEEIIINQYLLKKLHLL